MSRKIILVVISLFAAVFCVSCNKNSKAVEEYANTMADSIENGDMDSINNILFGSSALEIDETVREILPTEDGHDALSVIFSRVSIDVEKVKRKEVVYEIEAPDLSGFFDDFPEENNNFSEEEFAEYYNNYVNNAELKKITVSVPYAVKEKQIIVNYQDEEFIDAVTGGLLEGYKKAYQEMIEEYMG